MQLFFVFILKTTVSVEENRGWGMIQITTLYGLMW